MQDDLKKIAALYVGAGIAFIVYTQFRKEQETKRTEILKEVDAINRAASVIVDRIRRGYYNGKSLAEIHQEFEFEQIAQHPDTRDLTHS